jgi:hypothetical protein
MRFHILAVLLRRRFFQKACMPRTPKTLRTTIHALFANELTEDELDRLIEQLTMRGVIRIADGKVHYELLA